MDGHVGAGALIHIVVTASQHGNNAPGISPIRTYFLYYDKGTSIYYNSGITEIVFMYTKTNTILVHYAEVNC